MDVDLRLVGDIVVHHHDDVVHVDAAGCDVRRDKDAGLALLELLEGLVPGNLRLAAVDSGRVVTLTTQVVGEPVRSELRACEHQRAAFGQLLQHLREHTPLPCLIDGHQDVLHAVSGFSPPAYLDRYMAIQGMPRQPVHVYGDSGREEQCLALGGQRVEYPMDIGRESHVEHPVCLVQDQHLELGAVHVSATHMVEQASGRGDHDIDAIPERACLRLHADATIHGDGLQSGVAAVGPRTVPHLLGELAGRHQNKRPQPAVRTASQTLKYRQEERGGLAGSGLC